jgi:hypothetical protein
MLHRRGGTISVCIGTAAQLHWSSVDAFDAWVDRLHTLVRYEVLLHEGDGTAA